MSRCGAIGAIGGVALAAVAGAALAPAAAPALAAVGGLALGLLAAIALAAAPRRATSTSGAPAVHAALEPRAATGPEGSGPDATTAGAPEVAAPAPPRPAEGPGPAVAPPPARPIVIDTSALIDGRLGPLRLAGFLDGPLLVPRAVALELQRLLGSQDRQKRGRGQRGLDLLEALRAEGDEALEVVPGDAAEGAVDEAVLALARARGARIVTTDGPLARLARLEGIPALHLHEAARALQSRAQQGERVTVTVIRPGDGPGQGLGYLEDGSPVVIEGARERVGVALAVEVTSVRRSKSGTMYFARPAAAP